METDYRKFFKWLLKGITSTDQLLRKIKKALPNTVNPVFVEIMEEISNDVYYAECLIGLGEPSSFAWSLS
jgi:hypothetical protein